jgi:hypothetical protein
MVEGRQKGLTDTLESRTFKSQAGKETAILPIRTKARLPATAKTLRGIQIAKSRCTAHSAPLPLTYAGRPGGAWLSDPCGGPPGCAGAAGAGARFFSGWPRRRRAILGCRRASWRLLFAAGRDVRRAPLMLSHDNQDRLGSRRRRPSIP